MYGKSSNSLNVFLIEMNVEKIQIRYNLASGVGRNGEEPNLQYVNIFVEVSSVNLQRDGPDGKVSPSRTNRI